VRFHSSCWPTDLKAAPSPVRASDSRTANRISETFEPATGRGQREKACRSPCLTSTANWIVARYADRWPTKACCEDGKGLWAADDACNRIKKAAGRTLPSRFLTMTLHHLVRAARTSPECRR
jgi:hypothetical protein